MASIVEVCNLALSHLGDTATVASIDPPEGSAQAEHCARFYPMARDALLENPDASWKFATRRGTLAELSNSWAQWDHAYAMPADCIRVIAVLDPAATDDQIVIGVAQPQPFTVEVNDEGQQVILTDQADAIVRYVWRQTDPTFFTPLFVLALSHQLAAMLAGPVLKGDVGAAESKRQLGLMQLYLSKAVQSDDRQHRSDVEHTVGWISGR